jgi:hypothetical protein
MKFLHGIVYLGIGFPSALAQGPLCCPAARGAFAQAW